MRTLLSTAAIVLRKELVDALRDRRTWMLVLATSLLTGPLTLWLLARMLSGIEDNAARREVVLDQIEYAPSLVNFLQRSGATVLPAPPDYEAALRAGTLANAVVVVGPDFEAKLAQGEAVEVQLMYDTSASKAQQAVRQVGALLRAYNRELGTQRLLARGVAPQLLSALDIQEADLASAQASGAQLLFLVPWLALLGAVVGAISVAIDVTAGERERGSLEPLLLNPVPVGGIVLGKWGAVAACAGSVVLLTLGGFASAQWWIGHATLSTLMQFGVQQMALFLALLLPFAACVAALVMLAATFGRTYKEAQTYASYLTVVVNLVPALPLLLSLREAAWQRWVPGIGQMTALMRTLRGDPLALADVLVPALVAVALTALALLAMTRLLRREDVVFGGG